MKNVHFSSKTVDWETPEHIFEALDSLYGPLILDVCATHENTKCAFFYSKKKDGLTQKWEGRCWMNPPYGREINKWIAKAAAEARMGNATTVCLLPSRTDTRWFHDHIYRKPGVEIVFLKGRIKFGGSTNSAPFPSMVVIFRPQ